MNVEDNVNLRLWVWLPNLTEFCPLQSNGLIVFPITDSYRKCFTLTKSVPGDRIWGKINFTYDCMIWMALVVICECFWITAHFFSLCCIWKWLSVSLLYSPGILDKEQLICGSLQSVTWVTLLSVFSLLIAVWTVSSAVMRFS